MGDAGFAAEDELGVADAEVLGLGSEGDDGSDGVSTEDVWVGGFGGVKAFGEVAVGGVEGGVVEGE